MDFSEVYPDSCSSVALAVRRGDMDALHDLLQRKKRSCEMPDNRGWRPIHEAAYWDKIDCLKFMIQRSGVCIIALQ